MARFDVHRMRDGSLVIDCQADIHANLTTRLVVPLLPASDGPAPIARLNPTIAIGDDTLVFYADLATAVPARDLGRPILSVADQEYVVIGALDVLLTGI